MEREMGFAVGDTVHISSLIILSVLCIYWCHKKVIMC